MKKLLLVPLFGLISMMAFAQCPPTAPLSTPLTVDFESENTFATSGSHTLANCWVAGAAGTSAGINWRVDVAGTSSGSTGPSIDHTLGTSAGKYLYLETSGGTASNGDSVFFTSPDIDITTLTSPQVSFFYHMYGALMGDLVIDVYDGTSWHYNLMTISGQKHTASNQAYTYTALSLGSFSNDTIQIRFKGIRGTGFTGDMAIDDIKVENAPACPFPINLFADQIQPYQANLHWGSVTAASTYSVIYGLTGFDPSSAGTTVNNIATDSVQVASLIAASDYDFYVIANCGTNGLSDTAGPGKFATGCAAKQTPFTENFDGVSGGSSVNPSLPNCWDLVESFGAFGYGYTYGFISKSTPNSFRMYNSSNTTNSDTLILVSADVLGLDSGTKQVTFYARAGSAFAGTHQVKVGTINSAGDVSSFNLITTVSLSTSPLAFDEYIVLLDSSSGNNLGHSRIAFMHGNFQNYQSIYIDDVTIEDIPPCPKPVSFVLDFVTNDSAGIAWSGTGVKYNGEYGPTGFTQGTGTFFTPLQTADTLFGLAGNTYYDIYLQNDCQGSNNGTSVWSGPFTFKTLCDPFIGSLTENFDGTTGSNSANNIMPDCWSYYETPGTAGYGYVYNSSFYAKSPTQMLRLYNSSGFLNGDTVMAISPQFTDMPGNGKQIRLNQRTTSTFLPDRLIIGTVASPGDPASLVIIDTLPTATSAWIEYLIRIDASNGYNGTHEYIVIMHGNSVANYKTLLVDDVSIEPIPACIAPTGIGSSNVTQTSALISWSPGGGSVFELEYGVQGFTQGTGSPTTGITDSSLVLNGLIAQTCYDVYVRDSCSDGSFSPWTGPYTFCTPCSAKNTPISENFDTTPLGSFNNRNVPECWGNYATGNGYGYVYSSTWNPANSVPNMYYWTNSNGFDMNDTLLLISPSVIELDSMDKMVKFYARYSSTFSQGSIVVGTVASQDDPSTFVALDTIALDINWKEYSVVIDTSLGYNGTHMYIALGHASVKNYQTIYLDDISIELVPLCSVPFNLKTSGITATSATAKWNSTHTSGNNFRIEYGLQGFTQVTGAGGNFISNTSSPTTISNLSSNTWYDYYVADNCDSNTWAGPFSFKTECLGQLSGTYTVGGTPGANNFATLDSAVAVLAGCGITGSVTFNLQGGTFPTSMKLGQIQGASSTNTITFNGGGVSSDTIKINVGITIGIELDNTSYMTFQNLTIDGVGANRVVWMHNNAHHITFDNCNILATLSTSSLYGGIIAAETSTSIFSYGNNANDVTIKDCYISGGYVGIVFNGTSTVSYSSNNSVINTVIDNPGTYGMRFYYQESLTVKGCEVSNFGGTFGYGIYNYYIRDFEFSGNSVFAPTYGIYISQGNRFFSPSSQSMVYNNFLGGSNTYGLYFSSVENADILHNSIKGGSRGFYLSGLNDTLDIRNNIIVGGAFEALYNSFFGTAPNNMTVDYNIYDKSGTNIARWGSTTYLDLAAWQTGDTTRNDSSLQGDPGFLSATDFHIVGTLPNDVGDNNTTVVTDIDGDARPATGSTRKDIGADEFSPLDWDASFENMIVRLAGCGDSTLTVEAVIKNFGQLDITSLPITVNVTGGVTQMLNTTYTTTIPSGQVDTIMIGSINTYAGAAGVNFMGYSSLANDQKTSNDTLNEGQGNYTPVEPQFYPEDSVCANIDSAYFAAVAVPGVQYGWYANMTDTVPTATGDTLNFAVNGGQKTWYLAYLESADSLSTPFNANNGQAGNAFDVLPTNTISINAIDCAIDNLTAHTVNVYYRSGSYVGFATSATGWTLHESVSVTGAGAAAKTYVPFTSPMVLQGGSVSGMMVVLTTGTNIDYTNGTAVGTVLASNSDLIIYEGSGVSWPLSANFNPRLWNGTIHYGSAGCSGIRKALTIGLNTDTAVASFTKVIDPNGADVSFDGSASKGQTYTWDFGDGGVGSGMTTNHTYTSGTYTACLVVTDTICGSTDTICETVIATIGLDEGLIGQTITVYPNPNDGIFRVDFEIEGLKDLEIRITDVTGRVVFTKDVGKASGAYRENIDISNYAKGMYLLQIKSDDVVVSRRVTIQ